MRMSCSAISPELWSGYIHLYRRWYILYMEIEDVGDEDYYGRGEGDDYSQQYGQDYGRGEGDDYSQQYGQDYEYQEPQTTNISECFYFAFFFW